MIENVNQSDTVKYAECVALCKKCFAGSEMYADRYFEYCASGARLLCDTDADGAVIAVLVMREMGAVLCGKQKKCVLISWVCVDERHRHMGVCKGLMDYARKSRLVRGTDFLYLSPTDTYAERLYASVGYFTVTYAYRHAIEANKRACPINIMHNSAQMLRLYLQSGMSTQRDEQFFMNRIRLSDFAYSDEHMYFFGTFSEGDNCAEVDELVSMNKSSLSDAISKVFAVAKCNKLQIYTHEPHTELGNAVRVPYTMVLPLKSNCDFSQFITLDTV